VTDVAHVLLVEDDLAFAQLTTAQIAAHAGEFSVRRVATASAAQQAIATGPVDVVLLDLGLTDSEGLATLSLIQRALPRETPVVVFTARDDLSMARAAMQVGAQDYLVKGRADEDALIRALRYALERASFQRRLLEAEEALRASEARLREAQKMEAVGRLAGGIAHDFNNVLTAIFGYSDLIMDGLDLLDPRRADALEIKRAAERAAGLTRQLLAFSRKQVMQPRRVLLDEVVAGMDSLLARLVGPEIEIVIAPGARVAEVMADPGQLEQVLMNLAANARDAMPEGGRLTIAMAEVELSENDVRAMPGLPPGQFVRMTVSDTGVGMTEEIRGNIFEPFFTTKEVGKGTGLGLATVYGIVKQSGGWIYAESAAGHGTTFTMLLPRVGAISFP